MTVMLTTMMIMNLMIDSYADTDDDDDDGYDSMTVFMIVMMLMGVMSIPVLACCSGLPCVAF